MNLAKKIVVSVFAYVVTCYALVWLLSPWLVRTLVAKPLAAHNVVISDKSQVRLNLFVSRLTVSDVALLHQNKTTYSLNKLRLDYSIWPLLKGEVHITRVHLNGMQVHLSLVGEQLQVAGFLINPEASDTAQASQTQSDTDESSSSSSGMDVHFEAPDIELEDIQFSLNYQGHAHVVHVHKMVLQRTQYSGGEFQSAMHLNMGGDGFDLTLQADATVAPGATAANVDLQLNNLNPAPYTYLLPPNITTLNALASMALKMRVKLQEDVLDIAKTSLALDIESIDFKDEIFAANLGAFSVKLPELTAHINLSNSAISASTPVDVSVSDLGVHSVIGGETLVQLKNFISDGLQVDVQDNQYHVLANGLELKELLTSKVNEQTPALFSMESIVLQRLDVTPEKVSLGAVTLGAGAVNVFLDKSGEMLTLINTNALSAQDDSEGREGAKGAVENGVVENGAVENGVVANGVVANGIVASSEIESGSMEEPKVKTSAVEGTEQNDSPQLLLGALSLEQPLAISISDKSNSYDFEKTFYITSVNVGELNSTKPDQKTDFIIALKDESYFRGDVKGWAKPFTPKLNLDAGATLKEFSLHEVAPYLKDSLGFEVKAGQLDLDFSGSVTNDMLASKSKILMRGTEFGASEKVDEANLIGQTAIPLNVALGMLKDGNGNIELKIPVNGDVKAPSFGVHHIVGLVIKKVAMSQAKKQLMTMFVPYAQVVSVAISAGSYALKVRFEDLPFEPQQKNISPAQTEFVQQMIALMNDKKDVQVRVCPVAVPSDLPTPVALPLKPEQHKALLAIAQERAQAFKTYMVEHGSIASSRLLICAPSVEVKEKAKPRINFGT